MGKTKTSKKKLPGEIDIKTIELGSECRKYLYWYYAIGGNDFAFGEFKGKIILINQKGILFKRLYIDFVEMDGNCVEGKEDHIWIFDKAPFIKVNIKVKDCVSFTGKVYAYKRKDKSIDFSLKECQHIKKIEPYRLPSKEDLQIQSLERIVCETCIYSEYCYGFCIAPEGWRDSMIQSFMYMINGRQEKNNIT